METIKMLIPGNLYHSDQKYLHHFSIFSAPIRNPNNHTGGMLTLSKDVPFLVNAIEKGTIKTFVRVTNNKSIGWISMPNDYIQNHIKLWKP